MSGGPEVSPGTGMCCYLATEVCVQICACSVLHVHVQCVLAVNGLLLMYKSLGDVLCIHVGISELFFESNY